jgi:hypothetical protein
MIELLREKKYELLSECSYFINSEYKKTKEVNLLALKFCDSDGLNNLSDYKTLIFLCDKGYILPVEGGKLKVDELDTRAAKMLIMEYSKDFLDLSPFLPIE